MTLGAASRSSVETTAPSSRRRVREAFGSSGCAAVTAWMTEPLPLFIGNSCPRRDWSSAWTKASWETGRLHESPIGANHPISPAAVQRMISQARLKISHTLRQEDHRPSLTDNAPVSRKRRVFGLCLHLCTIGGFSTLLEFFS